MALPACLIAMAHEACRAAIFVLRRQVNIEIDLVVTQVGGGAVFVVLPRHNRHWNSALLQEVTSACKKKKKHKISIRRKDI